MSPRFIADHMLGSLARWLRMMGYDCRYEKGLSDDEIIDLARSEGRIVLTRDERLAEKCGGACLRTTDLDEQLLEVSNRFNLKFTISEMRCSVCNGSLKQIDRGSVVGRIPEKSLEAASDFWQCDSCRKIYWDGTHWKGIIDRFKRLRLIGDEK